MLFFFFFSSRRRHTRYIGDWSSDVCSSDLHRAPTEPASACRSRVRTRGRTVATSSTSLRAAARASSFCSHVSDIADVATGLWLWRLPYPDWRPRPDWGPVVSSTCLECGGEVVLVDPLAPPDGDDELWQRLDATPPTLVVVLKPDHVRDVDAFVHRYSARACG